MSDMVKLWIFFFWSTLNVLLLPWSIPSPSLFASPYPKCTFVQQRDSAIGRKIVWFSVQSTLLSFGMTLFYASKEKKCIDFLLQRGFCFLREGRNAGYLSCGNWKWKSAKSSHCTSTPIKKSSYCLFRYGHDTAQGISHPSEDLASSLERPTSPCLSNILCEAIPT